MSTWQYNPNEYTENSYSIIPAGDHRVRIEDVVLKNSRAGNEMFEITLAVSAHSSKVWYYLVLDPNDTKKTNQRLGTFFECFGITDYDMSHYRGWVGKVGGVRVKHEEYNGNTSAKVAFCLSKKNQEKLPAPNFGSSAPATAAANIPEDLPFF